MMCWGIPLHACGKHHKERGWDWGGGGCDEDVDDLQRLDRT